MCNEGPAIVRELAEDAEKGWLPLIAITGQIKLVDGEAEVNVNDLHFLWAISPQLAMQIGVRLVAEMQVEILREAEDHARRN